MSSLFDINFSVPSSVSFKWERHTSLSNHVTEGSLSSSWSSWTTNSWNTRYGSTSTPRFCRVFHTSFWINSMSLSTVFRKISMNKLYDIKTNWCLKYSWKCYFNICDFWWIINVEYWKQWSCGHGRELITRLREFESCQSVDYNFFQISLL